MSKQIYDGGPAFPRPPAWSPGYQPEVTSSQRGMTRRQWLAGLAMKAFIQPEYYSIPCDHMYEIARDAYAMADAMIAYERAEAELNKT